MPAIQWPMYSTVEYIQYSTEGVLTGASQVQGSSMYSISSDMIDRTEGRGVHFFDASRPDEPLGGLHLNEPTVVTHAIFLSMLDILIVSSSPLPYEVLLRGSGNVISRTNDPLHNGNYDIRTKGTHSDHLERYVAHESSSVNRDDRVEQ